MRSVIKKIRVATFQPLMNMSNEGLIPQILITNYHLLTTNYQVQAQAQVQLQVVIL